MKSCVYFSTLIFWTGILFHQVGSRTLNYWCQRVRSLGKMSALWVTSLSSNSLKKADVRYLCAVLKYISLLSPFYWLFITLDLLQQHRSRYFWFNRQTQWLLHYQCTNLIFNFSLSLLCGNFVTKGSLLLTMFFARVMSPT